MRRFRWVFLVLCGLVCVVLVVPVRSATNLVVNGDFPDSSALNDWTKVGSGTAVLSSAYYRSADYALTPQNSTPISYAQCMNLSAPSVSIDVGGSVRFPSVSDGSIVIEFYGESDCGGTVLDDITLVPVGSGWGREWADLSQMSYDLPVGASSVKITLNGCGRNDDLDASYFDDIFLYEYGPTSVLVVQPSGRAPTGLIAAAVLVSLAVAVVFLRRH